MKFIESILRFLGLWRDPPPPPRPRAAPAPTPAPEYRRPEAPAPVAAPVEPALEDDKGTRSMSDPAPEPKPAPKPLPTPGRDAPPAAPATPARVSASAPPAPNWTVLRLDGDVARMTPPGGGRPAQEQSGYRRPDRNLSGTYTARKQGDGIVLSRGGTTVTTVYPYDRAGTDDLGLQFLMWQMLMQSIENDREHTIRIEDYPQAPPQDDPNSGQPAIDPYDRTQNERDAIDALGALGYEATRPDAPVPDPVAPSVTDTPAPAAPDIGPADQPPRVPEPTVTPVPEPDRSPTPEPSYQEPPRSEPTPAPAWEPSGGAYGR